MPSRGAQPPPCTQGEIPCNRAQSGLELHSPQTQEPMAREKWEFTAQPHSPLPVPQQGNQSTEDHKLWERHQPSLPGAQLCPASCQKVPSKARGTPPPPHSDHSCPTPLHQPHRRADDSCLFTAALQESCPPVPGTAARIPAQSPQSAHSGSGALGCGAPPAPAAQAQGTLPIKEISISTNGESKALQNHWSDGVKPSDSGEGFLLTPVGWVKCRRRGKSIFLHVRDTKLQAS